jgi:hypothetical protein
MESRLVPRERERLEALRRASAALLAVAVRLADATQALRIYPTAERRAEHDQAEAAYQHAFRAREDARRRFENPALGLGPGPRPLM